MYNITKYIMTKKIVNYSNTIIYKFVCKNSDVKDVYVGHTTDFRSRKSQHKNNCINTTLQAYNYKIYQLIRENGGWDNWEMVEIEKYPCNDNNEARLRERFWYEELSCSMNSRFPIRNKKEYRKIYKEAHKEYFSDYYQSNKEQILERSKENYENNKERKLAYQKQYGKENRDKIRESRKEYVKAYYEKNKDKINENLRNKRKLKHEKGDL